MADKKPAAAAPADAAAKPKLPLVPIIGAAVGSAVLVAGIMFFMMPKPAPAKGGEAAEHAAEGEHGEGAEGEGEGEPKAETRYVEVKEPLVVNLTGGSAKYLQVKVQIGTRSEPGQKTIETHMPALQNRLLAMLQQATSEELDKPDAMATLQEKAKEEANKLLEDETGKKDTVSAVVFTSFVKQ